ncbi:MAG: nucleotide exchange factor GrpE [Candidatus Spechtbacteria bacterium RIFCSPLOWO2_12_FULL_38_22]|uniref:Protein GrpE n=1 Tax=Candidatus Spechtbacteria bacterium RIFCSPLOWO2_12_FULL_38_22 TaxID=1802165 RepID=A0A1G2HHE4_9BACT|nr:MAG: nucleotide exchange factor GrpE [Candidatus Spechtbacteria bacterium RIFCSPHIGHO2_01_FULL_38_11]OGZ59687.1 MAG: nucleotide exchange factor GrpE [Candidatus Spechtbacteria bacterium RIFCSPHIGHO2_12_FULL_38_30]OGZ61873.1 MAG: nucleotide exchange factor GrpE [Candidatus Spechtbacteria bacterium RIFCSPLOWO2_12_FULL_38_22]
MSKQLKPKKDPEFIEEAEEVVEEYVKKIKKRFKKAQKEAKEYLDGWQRERANFANYKKDIEKYIETAREKTKEEVLFHTLSIVDNLELMLRHVDETIRKSNWFLGVEQAYKHAQQTLKNLGVEEISAKEGDKFNPNIHEAIGGEGDIIAEVLKRGHKIGDKVLRPVQVKVKK